jgi:hypothetical protein
LTDDDGARRATVSQAGGGERRRKNPEKFHTKLNSCWTAKLRLTLCRKKGAVTLRPRWRPFTSLRAHQFFELALMLVRLDHIASRIINADHGTVRVSDEDLHKNQAAPN